MSQISPQAQSLIDTVKACKGQFIRVEYRTNVKTAAAHKDVTITKFVNGIFRTGIDYANKASVQQAIASGERGEVQPLSWGEWAVFPWIIVHKGAEYVRLFPVLHATAEVRYELESGSWPEHNGTNISKDVVAKFLTPGDKAKLFAEDREVPECITKKLADVSVIGCWHNETSQEIIDAELDESGEKGEKAQESASNLDECVSNLITFITAPKGEKAQESASNLDECVSNLEEAISSAENSL